jgi:hypothetical protein
LYREKELKIRKRGFLRVLKKNLEKRKERVKE